MRSLIADLEYGARILKKYPLGTFSAVLALATGIAFNSTMFSVADSLLFRPLLVPEMDRIVTVDCRQKQNSGSRRPLAPAAWQMVRDLAGSFETLSVYRSTEGSLTGEQRPQRVSVSQVTASFFDVMRVKPLVGRTFVPEDEAGEGRRVLLLSYAVWEQRFGADRQVIGQSVRLNGEPFLVAGVMPSDFRFPLTVDLWTPLRLTATEQAQDNNFYLHAAGRLKDGVSEAQAQAELASIFRRISERYPASHGQIDARAGLLRDSISGDLTRQYTYMMIGAALFLLVICCANVANLQFARFASRTREMSVRSAMGASGARLFRQLLSENFLLALMGGLASLILAYWAIDLIRTSMPAEVEQFLPGWHRMGLNVRTLMYTMGVVMVACLTAGIAPSLLLSRAPAAENLKDATRSSTGGRARQVLRNALVISQIVLSLVLLAGSTLMVKGFGAILSLWPNVEAGEILTFRVALPESRYGDDEASRLFFAQMLDKLRGVPGVNEASLAAYVPQSQRGMSTPITVEGADAGSKFRPIAGYQSAAEGYFHLMRIPIVQGRAIESTDREAAEPVAVVNQAFVREILKGRSPVGTRVAFGPPEASPQWLKIVGVSGDIVQDYVDRVARPMLFTSHRQFPERANDVVIRAAGDPMSLAPAVRQIVESIDRDQPVFEIRTYLKLVEHSLSGIAYVAAMMGVLGGLALFLSILGVYSLVAFAVTERTRELGVRLALGASARSILWMVLGQGFRLAVAGLVLGLPLAYLVVRLLSGLVFGTSANDIVAFGVVPLLLGGAAVAASYFPALRATHTDPTTALHYE